VANIKPPHRLRFIVRHPILHNELDYRSMGFKRRTSQKSDFRSRPGNQVEHATHPFMTPFMATTLRDELGWIGNAVADIQFLPARLA
jgi:hypothetical protein